MGPQSGTARVFVEEKYLPYFKREGIRLRRNKYSKRN